MAPPTTDADCVNQTTVKVRNPLGGDGEDKGFSGWRAGGYSPALDG